jgi:hypothetical protein
MNRPSPGQAAGLGGISIAAGGIAVAVAQIELGGQAQPHIWSNAWLLLALALAGTGLLVAVVIFVMSMFSRVESKPDKDLRTKQDRQTSEQGDAEAAAETGHPQEDQGEPAGRSSSGPAFTDRWRYTSDGFEASPLMRMANLSMPGFMSYGASLRRSGSARA